MEKSMYRKMAEELEAKIKREYPWAASVQILTDEDLNEMERISSLPTSTESIYSSNSGNMFI